MDSENLKNTGKMTTLSEVINELVKRGYTQDFNIKSNEKAENKIQAFPDQFLIDKYYRFEGESDPEDEAIIYAISSIDSKIKGLLVNGYGTSSDYFGDEIMKKIKTRTS